MWESVNYIKSNQLQNWFHEKEARLFLLIYNKFLCPFPSTAFWPFSIDWLLVSESRSIFYISFNAFTFCIDTLLKTFTTHINIGLLLVILIYSFLVVSCVAFINFRFYLLKRYYLYVQSIKSVFFFYLKS